MTKHAYYMLIFMTTVTCLVIAGFATADIPVNQTPETQGIGVVTHADVQGTVTESDSLAWQQSSDTLNDPPLTPGGYQAAEFDDNGYMITGWTVDPDLAALMGISIPAGEVQYTAGYNENTMAVQGMTSYAKATDVNTANEIPDKNNIVENKVIIFNGTSEQGRMTSTEDILVDGTGAQTTSAEKILCPFEVVDGPLFPPFCNIAMSGSDVDASLASVSTSAGNRFVAATADVPVAQTYSISGTGVPSSDGTTDAIGSMSAFMDAHLQEGIMLNITPVDGVISLYQPVKAEDVSYSHSASTSGIIKTFSQAFTYQSGIGLV